MLHHDKKLRSGFRTLKICPESHHAFVYELHAAYQHLQKVSLRLGCYNHINGVVSLEFSAALDRVWSIYLWVSATLPHFVVYTTVE